MKGKLVPIRRIQQPEAPAPAKPKRKRRLKIRITRKREEAEKIQAWEVAYATVKRLGFRW